MSMKPSVAKRDPTTLIFSSDMEGFASDLSMAVWNKITHLSRLQNLRPKDYPQIYEAVYHILQRYHGGPKQTENIR